MFRRFPVLLCVLPLALASCKDEPKAMPQPNPAFDPSSKEEGQIRTSILTDEQVESLAPMSAELDGVHREIKTKQEGVSGLIKTYQAKGGQLPPDLGADLTIDQRELLTEKIENEPRSRAILLRRILETDTEISDLKFNILKLQSQLPHFVTAKEGDRHDRIMMDYLVGELRLSAKQAWDLVYQADLQQPLLAGFNVWIRYDDNSFGTWVTQGTAAASPEEIQERILQDPGAGSSRREAATAKIVYIERRAKDLSRDVALLESKRDELQQQVDELSAEEDAILAQLSAVKASLASAENTTRYLVGSKKQLKDKGIISTSFFKGMRMKSLEGFEFMDLGESNEVLLDSSAYGLSKVKKVTLLPKVFQQGTDYELHGLEGKTARLSILNPDKFRQFKFVVVLEQ